MVEEEASVEDEMKVKRARRREREWKLERDEIKIHLNKYFFSDKN